MLPEVKRRMEEVQVVNLKLTDEVEKLENMLKLQSGINRGNIVNFYDHDNTDDDDFSYDDSNTIMMIITI